MSCTAETCLARHSEVLLLLPVVQHAEGSWCVAPAQQCAVAPQSLAAMSPAAFLAAFGPDTAADLVRSLDALCQAQICQRSLADRAADRWRAGAAHPGNDAACSPTVSAGVNSSFESAYVVPSDRAGSRSADIAAAHEDALSEDSCAEDAFDEQLLDWHQYIFVLQRGSRNLLISEHSGLQLQESAGNKARSQFARPAATRPQQGPCSGARIGHHEPACSSQHAEVEQLAAAWPDQSSKDVMAQLEVAVRHNSMRSLGSTQGAGSSLHSDAMRREGAEWTAEISAHRPPDQRHHSSCDRAATVWLMGSTSRTLRDAVPVHVANLPQCNVHAPSVLAGNSADIMFTSSASAATRSQSTLQQRLCEQLHTARGQASLNATSLCGTDTDKARTAVPQDSTDHCQDRAVYSDGGASALQPGLASAVVSYSADLWRTHLQQACQRLQSGRSSILKPLLRR